MNLCRFFVLRLVPAASLVLAGCGLAASQSGTSAINCVIELFTSQGCSSCPAADRLLAAMARKPDVVALTLPVDYWDYIGWKDTFAAPAFTERQKAYAALHGGPHVFTPEAIVDGLTGAIGSDSDEIQRAIRTTRGLEGALTLPMRLVEMGGRLSIELPAGTGGPAGVFLLRVARARTVHIGRGENAGRVVTYANVVRAISKLGEWTGSSATFETAAARGDDEGYVVLVQRGTLDRLGAILAAAKTPGL